MSHVLVLGGGFGGVAAARTLREQLPDDHKITLIDKRDYYMIGFRKTWGLLGEAPLAQGQRKLADLQKFGIDVLHGTIEHIDPAERSVVVDGQLLQGDAMIVALGAELAVDEVPGFEECALNAYDPAQVEKHAQVIEKFIGGRIVVGVFGLPYKCPPAPYELAILLEEKLHKRGIPVEITVFTPMPNALPILDGEDCATLDGFMLMRGIRFLPGLSAEKVEPGRVLFSNGSTLDYDLLLGIPGHRAPKVVRDSGLTGSVPWIPVNGQTLETAFQNVYAIGDVTAVKMGNGQPLPKAGVFAEGEGLTVADRLAAILTGRPPTAVYEGHGGCFLEVGDGKAVMVEGHFLAPDGPLVRLTPASEAYMDDKWAFETSRLSGWFD